MWTDASVSNLCLNHLDCYNIDCYNLGGDVVEFDGTRTHLLTSGSSSSGLEGTRSSDDEIAPTTSRMGEHGVTVQHVNPYHVLQVRQDATPSEIRLAYQRLALWHHPGRKHDSNEERRRRLQVFEIISASYETLMDRESRRRYDYDLKESEWSRLTAGLPTGELFVGGKRIIDLSSDEDDTDTDGSFRTASSYRQRLRRVRRHRHRREMGSNIFSNIPTTNDSLPDLSRTSSQSTLEFDGGDDGDHILILESNISGERCRPGYNDSSSSEEDFEEEKELGVSVTISDSNEAEIRLTDAEANRLFGGPLAALYRARLWESFTDPFVLFEQVFGSQLFPSFDVQHIGGRLEEWMPLRPTRNPAWVGSSQQYDDGATKVFTTTRALHDRQLTRTETISIDPKTRRRRSFVTVTASDVESVPSCVDTAVTANYTGDALDARLTRYLIACKWIGDDENVNNSKDCTLCNTAKISTTEILKLCWT